MFHARPVMQATGARGGTRSRVVAPANDGTVNIGAERMTGRVGMAKDGRNSSLAPRGLRSPVCLSSG